MSDPGDPVASIERSVLALRRRQRRKTLAGELPPTEIWAIEVADAIATRDRDTSVADVAVELGIDPSQASRRVASAVEFGLVARVADQRDGRLSILTLTPHGERALTGVRRHRQSIIHRAIDQWSPTDRSRFATLLARFLDDLDRPSHDGESS